MVVLKFFESIRTEQLNQFFQIITMFGEETLMIVLIVALWFAFDKNLAKKLFFITATSLGVNSIIKNFAKVPRPFSNGEVTCVRPETATGYSFPSGHTQNFTTWSTAWAINAKNKIFTVCVIVLIPLIAISRVYLGAHYPSDVITGLVLGLVFAFVGNIIYDKVQNKDKLHMAVVLIFTPFIIYFLINPDVQYADFYKLYGMIFGGAIASKIEEKFAPINYDVSPLKKFIRVILGVIVAIIIKEGIKALNIFESLRISFAFDMLRYFVLVFVVVGICPVIFKKWKL